MSLPDFWKSLDMLWHAFTLVSKGLKFWSWSTTNFSNVLSSALMPGLAILLYHFSEKATPFLVPILLRMRAILISSDEYIPGLIEKYAFIALSHCEASDGLAKNGVGRAILISPVEVEVPVEGWVHMGLTGLIMGVRSRATLVMGLTDTGTWGKGVLGN